jgi:hypothetical protein
MHMARRAAAWVAWAVWTCEIAPLQAKPCNCRLLSKRERASARSFFVRSIGPCPHSDAGAGFQYRNLIVAWG